GFWPGEGWPCGFRHVYVACPLTVSLANASVLPSPLNSPPLTVTVAPLKEAVGSFFTLTAASAIEDVAATASSVAGISHRAFLIMVPFRLGIDEPSQPDGPTARDQSRARWGWSDRLPDREESRPVPAPPPPLARRRGLPPRTAPISLVVGPARLARRRCSLNGVRTPSSRAFANGRVALVPGPVLLAVDEDANSLSDIERELHDRYERSYRIVCVGSAAEAEAELARIAADAEEVALVLAGEYLGGAPGSEFLGKVRRQHPQAQRGLLIDYGSWGTRLTGQAIFAAMALRQIDYYVIRPLRTPDELFLQAISTFLLE